VFFLKAPAGLVIYWLINNVLSIVQQMLINRTYSPDVTKTAAISKG
jgi:membrane protein insertase Oxa1/YidC/SpoIIIJ